MIDGQTSATAMQKIRMRQQISEIFKIVDTSCQINLFYTAERFAGVGLGSIATIALTITFSIAVPKGVQQSNPLVLNLGGSSLILLTTTAAMLTFLNGTSNITNSRQVHNQALAVTNKLATKLTDTKISSGGPEMIEKIIHDIDNAIEPIAFFHLSIDDSVVKHSISDTPAGSATPAPPAP
jgi:Na+/phosphate symporter